MNAPQAQLARTWNGPHDESYFAGLAALEDAPLPAAPGTVTADDFPERDRSDQSDDARTLDSTLAAIADFMRCYVAFASEHEPVAIALWIAHAWLVERFETSPILAITSAELRSGKTRVLDCLELLCPTPRRMVLPSEAVTYTILALRPRPTLLLDEADALFGPRQAEKYEGLRAILNSGNRRGSPVLRVKLDGRRREVDAFDVYGPKAVAAIGDLPTTVADRSIPIRMHRRRPDEPIAKFRRRVAEEEAELLAFAWQDAPGTDVTDVTVPQELPDRAADSWEPLLAIADAAGGDWPARARLAAIALSADDAAPVTIGIRLLADIREVFGEANHLATTELLAGLHELDGSPWGEWYGKPLSARGLARLLAPYGIGPVLRRAGEERVRGYFRVDFEDAWARYVPTPASVTSVTSVPAAEPEAAAAGADQAPASEPDLAGQPVPAPGATIDCAEYRGHQSQHRQTPAGWVCLACHPPEAGPGDDADAWLPA